MKAIISILIAVFPILILSQISNVGFESNNVGKNCCDLYQVYQNITNPPSTFVNDYILAGENVDPSKPTGKVIINNGSGKEIVFQAKNEIPMVLSTLQRTHEC